MGWNHPMHRFEWIILWLAVGALVIDPINRPERARLGRDKTVTERAAGTFHEGGIDPTTDMTRMPEQVEFLGSWTTAGAFRGEYRTIWFRPERACEVLLAGTPHAPGSAVAIEVIRAGGVPQTITYSGANPGRQWVAWRVALPADALRLRVVARNDRAGPAGWLAFSVPLQATVINWALLLPLLKLGSTFALAWTVLCGPGLAWLAWKQRPASDLVLAIFPGPLLLCGLGLAIWVSGGWISGPLAARCGLGVVLAVLMGTKLGRARSWFRPEWRTVLAGSALIAGFAVSRANVSLSAPGELYGGTVSRTLEVGGHSDSRISYGVVQVTARHLAPFSRAAEDYFAPYSYTSRGPLAGWLATPIVLATGAQVPSGAPDQRWHPFDAQGFATYRIAMIVLASFAAWAVWGVACGLGGLPLAQLATAMVLLAPFFAHELYFTWPKLMSAAGVLAAFYQLRRRRPLGAGLALGIGYLFHPAALLSAPFLGFWTIGDRSLGNWPARWRQSACLVAAAGVTVLPWYLVGRANPAGASQGIFVEYFSKADGYDATWPAWWLSRWDNFANTFIPGYVAWFHSDHPSYNSVYGPSDGRVHFSLMYWSTFPFAVGLPLFVLWLTALGRGIRRHPAAAAVAVLGPALWIIVYWGGATTGFMRQCGHAFFLSALIFGAWSLTPSGHDSTDRWGWVLFLPWLVVVRCVDLWVMAFAAAIPSGWSGETARYIANDLCSMAVGLVCLAAAGALVVGAGRELSPGGILLGETRSLKR